MVRKYKAKNAYLQWSEESMAQAKNSVLNGHLGTRAAASHFKVPYTTLQRRIEETRIRRVFENDPNNAQIPTIRKSIGHPTIFSPHQETDLVDRLKSLSSRGFGHSSTSVRRAVYIFAKLKNINTPWSDETKMAGKDWFSSFMDRHRNSISLRKPEGLSKARAMGLNKEVVDNFYDVLKDVYIKLDLEDQPHSIYNVDESGFPMNNKPLKVVSEKGKREVTSLTSLERGENVTAVVCCSASGVFIPPFIIFKGKRMREEYKHGMPPGSQVAMSESGYINEDLFLVWLQHFQKHRSPGRCLLLLDGHISHQSLQSLEYCVEHQIELLCLPPHTTHVLQPLDRTVFKPLKTYYHHETNSFVHTNPTASITKFVFGGIFNAAWRKGATVGNAVKGFECTGINPFHPNKIPPERFLPSAIFDNKMPGDHNNECEEQTGKSSDIETSPNSNYVHQEPDNGTSLNPSTSFSVVLPTPQKNKRKKISTREKGSACHLTSPEHVGKTRAKKKLAFEKIEVARNKLTRSRNVTPDEKRKRQRRMMKRSPTSTSSSEEFSESSDEDNTPCGFCGVRYLEEQSLSKGDWISCQKCCRWFHEICVGARGKKKFICGKCL